MNDSRAPLAMRRSATIAGAAPAAGATPWHLLTADETAQRLGTALDVGISSEEAARRLATCGRNEIRETRGRGAWQMLLGQFTDFMILLLLAAAVISGFIGDIEDAAAILAIVVLNAIVGFVQEYRAEKALRALKQLAALKARVVRDGEAGTLPAAELVPGDIVLLDAGSVVPADLRLVEAVQLKVDEAALTGESHPVEKAIAALADAEATLGDRRRTWRTTAPSSPMVAAGASSSRPRMDTELGRIATLLAAHRGSSHPAAEAPGEVRQAALDRGHRRLRRRLRARRAARRADGADVPDGGEPRGGGRAGGAAGGDHHRPRAGRAADGREERAGAAAAGGRDAGLGHLHLLRQDRNADAEPDARRRVLRRRRFAARAARRAAAGQGSRGARSCRRWRSTTMPASTRAARWRAIRPRRRSTSRRATWVASRRRWKRACRASPSCRSTPTASA